MRLWLLAIHVCWPYILMPSTSILLHEYAAHTYVLSSMVLLHAYDVYHDYNFTSILPLRTSVIHLYLASCKYQPHTVCHCFYATPMDMPSMLLALMHMLYTSTHALPIYAIYMSGIVFASRTRWPHTVCHFFYAAPMRMSSIAFSFMNILSTWIHAVYHDFYVYTYLSMLGLVPL